MSLAFKILQRPLTAIDSDTRIGCKSIQAARMIGVLVSNEDRV